MGRTVSKVSTYARIRVAMHKESRIRGSEKDG